MPRNLSTLAIQQALAQESTEAWLFLLTVIHSETGETFRFVNNTEEVISNGAIFEPFPFKLQLSIDDEEHIPQVQMQIDNVDRALMTLVRSSPLPPEFIVQIVLSSTPDTIEEEVVGLKLLDVSYDAYILTGTLIPDDILNTRWPGEVVSLSAGYQGLFRQ